MKRNARNVKNLSRSANTKECSSTKTDISPKSMATRACYLRCKWFGARSTCDGSNRKIKEWSSFYLIDRVSIKSMPVFERSNNEKHWKYRNGTGAILKLM
jgi:hypothetical protein